MRNRNEIFETLSQLMEEMFEIDPRRIGPHTSFRELDIDSIDAVDLMVRLHEITGKRIPQEAFKRIVTVGDVVAVLEDLLNE